MRSLKLGLVACFVVGLTACSDDATTDSTTDSSGDATVVDTTPIDACHVEETPIFDEGRGNEILAIGMDATFYGLVFNPTPLPIQVGELKIVWRATGDGDLAVRYWAPDGRAGELTFGPEPHGGSSYDRPGEEWGTGFSFDEPGCWHIHLERTTGSGDAWIEVVAA